MSTFRLLAASTLIAVLSAAHAHALSATVGVVSFGTSSGDTFDVRGKVSGLTLGGATEVELAFGPFSQVVPLSKFTTVSTASGQKKIFKDSSGQPGLSKLVLNLGNGTFRAIGGHLVLSAFANPAPVRLVAGSFDQCTMPRFVKRAADPQAGLPQRFEFDAAQHLQFGCQLADVPKASPNGLLVGETKQVRIQARAANDPGLDPASVRLRRADKNSVAQPGNVCKLFDDGALSHGDDVAGDRIFSCSFPLSPSAPEVMRLTVKAKVAGVTVYSPAFVVKVVQPLTAAQIQTVDQSQAAAVETWEQNKAAMGDTAAARAETVNDIKALPGVADAGIAPDGVSIWIRYQSGIEGGLMLNPPGTRGGPPRSEAAEDAPEVAPATFTGSPLRFDRSPGERGASASSAPTKLASSVGEGGEFIDIGSNDVIVWDPYNTEFGSFNEGPALKELFEGSACPKYRVTHLKDAQATVDSVRTFPQYGTVIMSTHGAVNSKGQVLFFTGEKATEASMAAHNADLKLGNVVAWNDEFAIAPGFISSLPDFFEDALVWLGACSSTANATLANAFLGQGATTYYGFSQVVTSSFAESSADQLFRGLVEDFRLSGPAYDEVGPKLDPDPRFGHAVFEIRGAEELGYSTRFRNGSFETGDLRSWRRTGDGRVLTGLGAFEPTDRHFAGLVSTGLGQTTTAGTIEQDFCLPSSANQLRFDWNFSSEEFLEYCGSSFDDKFTVQMVTDAGTTTLFTTSVNALCNQTLEVTGLAFDKSGPGCSPTTGVGKGTGGNDCKVWSTDWRSQAVSLSSLASANGGKGVTLRVSTSDVGDSVYDSAVLVDNFEIVTP